MLVTFSYSPSWHLQIAHFVKLKVRNQKIFSLLSQTTKKKAETLHIEESGNNECLIFFAIKKTFKQTFIYYIHNQNSCRHVFCVLTNQVFAGQIDKSGLNSWYINFKCVLKSYDDHLHQRSVEAKQFVTMNKIYTFS